MNKTPLLWGKFQKNSRNHSKAAPEDLVQHGRTQDKPTKGLSLNNNHSSHTKKCLSKTKSSFVCEECKHVPSKNNPAPDVREKTKPKAESVNVDELLNKVQELRGHVQFFKNRYGVNSRSENPTISHYRKFFQAGGETDPLSNAGDFQKSTKNHSSFTYNHNKNVSDYIMLGNHQSPLFDRKFNRINNHPSLDFQTANHFKDKANQNEPAFMQPKVSTHQKNSNNSVFPPLQSNRQKFLRVNPRSDIKKFQTAAEDFIGQAEDLKAKIAYILDSCGYNLPSAANTDSLESLMSAISRERPLSKHSVHNAVSEHEVKRLFGTVNEQYKEILTTLLLIQDQIGSMNNAQKSEKKSKKTFGIFSKLWPVSRDCGALRMDSDLESCRLGKKETAFSEVPPRRRLRAGENSSLADQSCQQAFGSIWRSNSPVKNKIDIKKSANKTKPKSSKNAKPEFKAPAPIIPSKPKKKEKTKRRKKSSKKTKKPVTCFCF